jgi:hypothetical protein
MKAILFTLVLLGIGADAFGRDIDDFEARVTTKAPGHTVCFVNMGFNFTGKNAYISDSFGSMVCDGKPVISASETHSLLFSSQFQTILELNTILNRIAFKLIKEGGMSPGACESTITPGLSSEGVNSPGSYSHGCWFYGNPSADVTVVPPINNQ